MATVPRLSNPSVNTNALPNARQAVDINADAFGAELHCRRNGLLHRAAEGHTLLQLLRDRLAHELRVDVGSVADEHVANDALLVDDEHRVADPHREQRGQNEIEAMLRCDRRSEIPHERLSNTLFFVGVVCFLAARRVARRVRAPVAHRAV